VAPRDITGEKFGDLTAIRPTGVKLYKYNSPEWLCVCVCGKEKKASYGNLTCGITKSCGCLNKRVAQITGEKRSIHGHTRKCNSSGDRQNRTSPTYSSWMAMRERCYRKSRKNYRNYGGRGITVCERWHDFTNFLADMGERPKGMTLDRKDVDGNCEPGNCVWATKKEQMRNTRSNRRLTFRGETRCLKDWATELGVHPGTLSSRLRRGWTVDRALTAPLLPRGRGDSNNRRPS
jgi:hypothetical protein